MPKYAFLSPEWIEAARAVQSEHATSVEPPALAVRMNLVVEDVPFGEPTLDAHLDTSSGAVELDLGHLGAADVKVSLDYPTAKRIIVDGDGQAAMQAFVGGRIRVEGDITKLLAFQATPASGPAMAAAEQIRAFTE
ncbi:MAG: SCP2 sterol-binding domain-containing protein [Acidimicrobiales bacterium]